MHAADVLESISDAFYAVDADGRYIVFNRAAEEFFQASRDEVLGREMWEVFPEGRGTAFEAACNAARDRGVVTTLELPSVRRADHFVELRIGPLLTGGVTVALRDITERVVATRRLKELSEANGRLAAELEAVLSNLGEGVVLADADGRIRFVNDAAARIHGAGVLDVPPEDYATAYSLFTEDGAPYPVENLPLMRAVHRGEIVTDARWRVRRADGREVRAVGAARPILDADGRRTGAVLTVRDDTERQIAEEQLRLTSSRLDGILSNTRMAVFLMDERQHCSYMNDAAETLTGYRWEETRGRPLHDVIHHTRPDGSPFPLSECAIDRAFPENNQQEGEEVFVHKDGHFYPVAFTASPIRDAAANTIGTIIEARDITREKADAQARDLLMREVDHRSRNALMIVQSMLRLSRATDVEGFREAVAGRVDALARAQGSLALSRWHGAGLADVVDAGLSTVGEPGSYRLAGPPVMLGAEQVQPLSMLVHELATNARKYGALSTPEGRVDVSWSDLGESLRILWREASGPRVVQPEKQGFGSRLVRELAAQLRGELQFDWAASGLQVTLVFPRLATA